MDSSTNNYILYDYLSIGIEGTKKQNSKTVTEIIIMHRSYIDA